MLNRNLNILITGASSGIGEALAIHYAKTQAKNLFICGRNPDRLKVVENKCRNFGAVVYGQIIDVTDKEKISEWIKECNQIAELNLVIANAGIGVINETQQAVYDTFDTNIYGVLNTVLPTIEIYKSNISAAKKGTSSLDRFISNMKNKKQAFYVPFWSKLHLGKKGNEFFHLHNHSIAIVSSIAGYHGLATCPAYSATKACVKAWGEALRIKLRKEGINVSVICPGFVRSRITDQNTCPMPFFMEGDEAARIIAAGLNKRKGIIAFPWQLRFCSWLVSILPNRLSDKIYSRLPDKA